jgi:hypothetical protein
MPKAFEVALRQVNRGWISSQPLAQQLIQVHRATRRHRQRRDIIDRLRHGPKQAVLF